jgi:hypothetical protein
MDQVWSCEDKPMKILLCLGMLVTCIQTDSKEQYIQWATYQSTSLKPL